MSGIDKREVKTSIKNFQGLRGLLSGHGFFGGPDPTEASTSKEGISKTAIIGIACGAAALVLLVLGTGLGYFYYRRKKKKQEAKAKGMASGVTTPENSVKKEDTSSETLPNPSSTALGRAKSTASTDKASNINKSNTSTTSLPSTRPDTDSTYPVMHNNDYRRHRNDVPRHKKERKLNSRATRSDQQWNPEEDSHLLSSRDDESRPILSTFTSYTATPGETPSEAEWVGDRTYKQSGHVSAKQDGATTKATSKSSSTAMAKSSAYTVKTSATAFTAVSNNSANSNRSNTTAGRQNTCNENHSKPQKGAIKYSDVQPANYAGPSNTDNIYTESTREHVPNDNGSNHHKHRLKNTAP